MAENPAKWYRIAAKSDPSYGLRSISLGARAELTGRKQPFCCDKIEISSYSSS
jgi:hypothetical protein